jgi:hypothetical protein
MTRRSALIQVRGSHTAALSLLVQDPFPDGLDEAGFLRDADEAAREE